mmetsp:Transcript_20082/g.22423  ORF Transcript_20082/g.22423 Transcript_20082/m.22423 type:complete len:86 (+) Transcript_20082:158-415(+)
MASQGNDAPKAQPSAASQPNMEVLLSMHAGMCAQCGRPLTYREFHHSGECWYHPAKNDGGVVAGQWPCCGKAEADVGCKKGNHRI